MKVTLDTRSRMALQGMLPAADSAYIAKIVRETNEALSLSQEELTLGVFHREGESYENDNGDVLTVPPGQMHFEHPERILDKVLDVPAILHGIIASKLQVMDHEKKITIGHVDLYEQFVGEPTPPEDPAPEEASE